VTGTLEIEDFLLKIFSEFIERPSNPSREKNFTHCESDFTTECRFFSRQGFRIRQFFTQILPSRVFAIKRTFGPSCVAVP